MDTYRGRGAPRAPRNVVTGLAWIGAVMGWAFAAAVGAVVAVILAAGMLLVALVAVAPLAIAAAAARAARPGREPSDPNLLEARYVGGHSWVAYAADAHH